MIPAIYNDNDNEQDTRQDPARRSSTPQGEAVAASAASAPSKSMYTGAGLTSNEFLGMAASGGAAPVLNPPVSV